jgi:OOP family OmpA-OmpF porin
MHEVQVAKSVFEDIDMGFKYVGGILVTCLLLATLPAQAQEYGEQPFYFGFALGFPGSDEECDYYSYDCDGSDTSFKFYGGKRLHENLAFEISFQDLGKIRDREGSLTTTAESEGFNFSLHGIIPVADVGYFYGKAGYMLWDTEYTRIDSSVERIDDDGGDFTYGVGFALMFDEQYDFRIEFERLNELGDEFVPGGDSITVFSFGGSIYLD